jgi:hypothetical protein
MKKRYLDLKDREEQRLRKLKTRTPNCEHCGESNSVCLELHHIAGRKHHDDTEILCANCHRKASDLQLDHAPHVDPRPQGELATIGFYLLGHCDSLELKIETLRKLGHFLVNNSKD